MIASQEQAEYERDMARVQRADEYALRHLAEHLHAAGQHDKLYQLLTRTGAWMDAKFARLGGDDAYVHDLELAIDTLVDPLDADQLLTLIRLHAARQAVHERVGIYEDRDLETLVWLGRAAEAISHVRLRADLANRAAGLVQICDALRDRGQPNSDLLDEAYATFRVIRAPGVWAWAEISLAVTLARSGDDRAGALFGELQAQIESIRLSPTNPGEQSESRHELMGALIRAGRYDDAQALAQKLLTSDSDILGLNEMIVSELAVALAQAGRYVEAETTARSIAGAAQVRALSELAAALTGVDQDRTINLLDEAAALARSVENVHDRDMAQHHLVAALGRAGRYDEAVTLARSLPDIAWSLERKHQERMRQFDATMAEILADSDPSAGEHSAIKPPAPAEDAEAPEDERGEALVRLALELADTGDSRAFAVAGEARAEARLPNDQTRRAERLRDISWALARAAGHDQARAVARSIAHDGWRAMAFYNLALALADAGDSRADLAFDEAAAEARGLQDATWRARVLRLIALTLARRGDDRATTIFDEARAASGAGYDRKWRARALRSVARVLTRAGRYDAAGSVSGAIEEPLIRSWALADLALALAQVGDSRADALFRRAEAVGLAVEADPEGVESSGARYDSAGLNAPLIPTYTMVSDATGAVTSVVQSSGKGTLRGADEQRSIALDYLARQLCESGRYEQAEAVIRAIPTDWLQTGAWKHLVGALATAGQYDRAWELAQHLREPDIQGQAQSNIAALLARDGDSRADTAFNQIWSLSQATENPRQRAAILIALGEALAQGQYSQADAVFDAAAASIDRIPDQPNRSMGDPGRREAQRDLAIALARTGRYQRFAEAISASKSTAALREFALSLRQTGAAPPQEILDAVLQAAAGQADALGELAVALHTIGHGRAGAIFGAAWDAARAIENKRQQVLALCELAQALACASDCRADAIFDEAEQAARAEPVSREWTDVLRYVALALARTGYDQRATALAEFIPDYNTQIEARAGIATALASAGRFGRALDVLGPRQIDAFVQAMAIWSAELPVHLPISADALLETLRIAGWARPDWRQMHALILTPADRPALERDPFAARGYVQRGLEHTRAGRHDQALADFTRAIELYPLAAEYFVQRGVTYLSIGRYDEALADYTRAIDLDPASALAYIDRGLVHTHLKRYDEALADLNRAIELAPAEPLSYYNRGNLALELGRYDAALADYTRAIDLDPNFAQAYRNRGRSYIELEHYDQAEADYTRALEIDPAGVDIQQVRDYILVHQHKRALERCDRAIEQGPPSAERYVERGRLYRHAGRDAEALADLNRALALAPDQQDALHERGRVYLALDRDDEALADYNRVAALHPNDAAIQADCAILYTAKGRYQQALDACGRAIEADPAYARAYRQRAEVAIQLQRYPAALNDLAKAIELQPDQVDAYLNAGAINERLRRFPDALATYTQALQFAPEDARLYYHRGIVQRMLRRSDEALADMLRAIELDPNLADAYLCAGMLYKERGRLIRALVYLQQGAERGAEDQALVLQIRKELGLQHLSGNVYQGAIDALDQATSARHVKALASKMKFLVDPDFFEQLEQQIAALPPERRARLAEPLHWLRALVPIPAYEPSRRDQQEAGQRPGFLGRLFRRSGPA